VGQSHLAKSNHSRTSQRLAANSNDSRTCAKPVGGACMSRVTTCTLHHATAWQLASVIPSGARDLLFSQMLFSPVLYSVAATRTVPNRCK
jgi:hypothetical protein